MNPHATASYGGVEVTVIALAVGSDDPPTMNIRFQTIIVVKERDLFSKSKRLMAYILRATEAAFFAYAEKYRKAT